MIRRNVQISEIINLIKNRKASKQSPFLLVLGANFAGTFDNFLKNVLGTEQPELNQFFNRASVWGYGDKVASIQQHMTDESRQAFYNWLALLVRAGYFTSIITTLVDTDLEDALLAVGFRYGEIKVHVFGSEPEEHIKMALKNPDDAIHIFKLYGSVKHPKSVKFLAKEQSYQLNIYQNELRDLLLNDLILCGYSYGYDDIGLGQHVPGSDEAATWIIDEEAFFDSLPFNTLRVVLENRITSLVQGSPESFFTTLAEELAIPNSRRTQYSRYLDNYKLDAKERLERYASSWLGKFIDLSLSTVPVKLREMNRPYRTGETVKESFALEDAIKQFDKELIAVLGEPGAGKTTLLQQQAIKSLINDIQQIPVFVELSNYQELPNLSELILTELTAGGIPREISEELFSLGGFLVLLDGLNEVEEGLMMSIARETRRLYRLHKFVNQFVITCRIAEWPAILNKETKRLEVLSVSQVEAIDYLTLALKIDEQLARNVFQGLNWGVRQLAHTPLILNMLVSVIQELVEDEDPLTFWTSRQWENALPQNKAALYEQFLDNILTRDIEDGKAVIPLKLHHQALMHVARYMKNERLVLTYKEANDLVEEFYEKTQAGRYAVSLPDVQNDVMYKPPMITSKGSAGKYSRITFMHQSFQEYYTALDLHYRMQSKATKVKVGLADLDSYLGVEDKRWWETIILLSGMEKDATELVEYIITKKNLYLAARCIRDSQDVSPELVDKIIVYGLDNFKYDANFDYDMIYSFNMVFHKRSTNLPIRLLDDIKWWLGKYAKGEPRELQHLDNAQLANCLDTKDESFLIDVIYTIGQRQLDATTESLLEILKASPDTVRQQIVAALGRIKNPKCKKPLMEIVGDSEESPWLRAFALNSLGQTEDPDLIPFLSKYLLDPANPYRDSAAWALRKINHPSSKQALLDALNIQGEDLNEFSGKRYALGTTLFALGDLGDASIVPYILQWANNINDPFILEDVLYALGQLGDRQSIAFIVSHLSNTDAVVRRRAIAALTKLKATELVHRIEVLLKDPSPFVQEAAQSSIAVLQATKTN